MQATSPKNHTHQLDIEFVRKQFPALSQDYTFMDNAGGTHVPKHVIQNITNYLSTSNVQTGGTYKHSLLASEKHLNTHKRTANFINANSHEEIVFGASATMLFRILSITLTKNWKEGDEIIITNSEHEANGSCWTDLEKEGIKVKYWNINTKTYELELDDLKDLISSKTKLISITHCSNILGTINPVKEAGKIAHENGALFAVDGVAYAPHRLLDVQEIDADFYIFSCYKVFGPHIGLMYGKLHLLKKLESINHYFIGKESVPYKLQPGNFNFELTYGFEGVFDYLINIHNQQTNQNKKLNEREKLAASFNLIKQHEETLCKKLIHFITSNTNFKLIGSANYSYEKRVPTLSFIHKIKSNEEIADNLNLKNMGVKIGDFYAKKLVSNLNISKSGVIRVSLVHYNTLQEVEMLIKVLQEI